MNTKFIPQMIQKQKAKAFTYETADFKIRLLGTNHFEDDSVTLVRNTLIQEQPHIVTVELCRERVEQANLLGLSRSKFEHKYRDLLKIPIDKRESAMKEICRLILLYQASEFLEMPKTTHIPNNKYQLKPVVIDGFAIAGDMFFPFSNHIWTFQRGSNNCLWCRKAPYRIVLVDLPIEETYKQLADILTVEDKLRVKHYKSNFVKMFTDEDCLMKEIWQENDRLKEILIDHRDQYLANAILQAAQMPGFPKPTRVVALVGRRHVDGILSIWERELNN